jgi:hypothetical protein
MVLLYGSQQGEDRTSAGKSISIDEHNVISLSVMKNLIDGFRLSQS